MRKPEMTEPEAPARKLQKAGKQGDYPDVAFDPGKRQPYHLDDLGERCYHEVPEGFQFTKDGVLEPKVD